LSRKTILWLEIISIVVAIIGLAVYLPPFFSAVQNACTPEQLSAGTCSPNPAAIMGPGYFIGLFVIIVAGIVHLVAWIGALIRSAKMQTWGWFVAVLLLSNLGTLVYAIAGPPNQPMMAAAYPPQGYPPQYPRQ